eukprot:Colp12_sorted_trinity150504_noHs@32202
MSSQLDISDTPHRRFNALNGTWLLCSPHRAKRPWQGQQEATAGEQRPSYDPSCYLCPRNTRASSDLNPDYKDTYVFTNDFAALLPDAPPGLEFNEGDGLLRAASTVGTSRVICFSPNHNLTIARMSEQEIRKVVDEWVRQTEELGNYNYVQIFENKGAVMGCSNPHPHGQVWAQDTIPEEAQKEVDQFRKWRNEKNCCLLCDYVKLELEKKVRVVCENAHFVVLVPFWAYWPFEVLVLPKAHASKLTDLNDEQKDALAAILRQIAAKYDNLFLASFPYSMGLHQAPRLSNGEQAEFHFHFHFLPPLLRSATVKKFQVGYEMFADLCRDITAEQAADKLRSLSDVPFEIKH